MINFSKPINRYFLILFFLIPITIIVGPAVSLINILLIDFSFIVLMIYKKEFSFLKNKSLFYLFILYIYLIFNSFISIDYTEGVLRNFGFLRIIIFFVAINYFFQDLNFFRKVFKFWFLIIFIVLIDVFIESITGSNILGYGHHTYGNRIASFFKDELIVGGYLNGFYLIIIGFLFNELKKNINYLIIIFSIIFIISIMLTGERSNTIKALLGIIIFFIFYKNLDIKKKVIVLFTTFFLIFTLVYSSSFLKLRFIDQFNSSIKEGIYFQHYKSGFEVFKNYPFFGVGNKNYRVETCKEINKNDKYICETHPHQIYLELLSEHGLIGTFIILLVLYKLIFSKILSTFSEKNYIKIGSAIYLILVFTPLIPSGAFFTNYMLNIFAINLSIFFASDKKLNLFQKVERKI